MARENTIENRKLRKNYRNPPFQPNTCCMYSVSWSLGEKKHPVGGETLTVVDMCGSLLNMSIIPLKTYVQILQDARHLGAHKLLRLGDGRK